jgi:cytochrome c
MFRAVLRHGDCGASPPARRSGAAPRPGVADGLPGEARFERVHSGMSLEFNKAAAAVLTAGITFMVTGLVGQFLVSPPRLHEAAIATGEPVAAAAPSAPAGPTVEPISPLLAAANVDTGRGLAQRLCASCHNFAQGGPNGVGPNLYGVVGGPHAHAQGFNYSAALRALHDKPWDYEALNAFLAKPSAAVSGTRMAFAGINSAAQRADVIAYLRSLDPSPKPLP